MRMFWNILTTVLVVGLTCISTAQFAFGFIDLWVFLLNTGMAIVIFVLHGETMFTKGHTEGMKWKP